MPLIQTPRSSTSRVRVPRRRSFVVALVAASMLAACTSNERGVLTSSAEPASSSTTSVDASESSGTAVGSDTTAPDNTFDVAPVDWQSCGAGDCADLEVPLDYADPGGSTITIAMARLPATGPAADRIGSIFVNFGGPGGEGTETIQSFAPFVPAALRERFDIVSFDPRGVEDTSGLGCDDLIGDEPTELVDAADGFADEVQAVGEVWDRVMVCVANSPIINDIGTIAVANDLEMMRRAVGDDALTYLGFSYGTEIGWVYATLYPDSVRAMVLDGAVPPADDLGAATFSQLMAIDDAIGRWDQGCNQSSDCPLRDEGYATTIMRLMDELEANPIPMQDGTTFGPVDLVSLVVGMTYLNPVDWGPTFAAAVYSLDQGDVSSMVAIADAFEGGSEEATFWSVLCADGTGDLPGDDYEALYAEALAISPLVGRIPGGIFCDRFPGEIDGLPTLDTTGTPPLLVIGNTGDNATPYQDAVRLDQLLADSVLLTYDGPGHTITFFDDCVDAIVVDYFLDLTTPPEGTRCGNPSRVGDGWFVPVG